MIDSDPDLDDLLPEYDFSEAIQGKHYREYREGTEVVLLDPETARDEQNPA
jgi:hypothetical protein